MKKSSKIIIGVFMGLLAAASIALGALLGVYVDKKNARDERINAIYESGYYETVDSLKNIETKLSKVNAVSGKTVRRELLGDVWKECDIAVSNVTKLGSDGEETEAITKFLNQVGDYCYYLMGKIISGKELTENEKNNVKRFKELVGELKNDFAAIGENLVDGEKISADTLSDLTAVRDAIKSYSSIDYPELIYDGPFSDGLNDREAKFLDGKEEINEETAVNEIKEYFPEAEEIKKDGESSSSIPAYVLSFKEGEREYGVFVTKKGGYIASVNSFGEMEEHALSADECVEKGRTFLGKLGYENMESVWVYDNNSTVYINFAFKEENVVYYPDLIKVKVSASTGAVMGMDATEYIYNHTEREVSFDRSGEDDIVVNDGFTVTEARDCVIPTEWNTEIFCKEIVGEYEGSKYYIYYDLSNGEEVRAMVVIDEDGDKLI